MSFLETYCGSSTIWDPTIFENDTTSDTDQIPSCFRYIPLPWADFIVILLITPFNVYFVQKFYNKGHVTNNLKNYSWLFCSKMLIALGLLVANAVTLALVLNEDQETYPAQIITPIMYMINYIFYMINEWFSSHKFQQKRNGALWFFWLVSLVSSFLLWLSYLIPYLENDSNVNKDDLTMPSIYLALTAMNFVNNCLAEPAQMADQKVNPAETGDNETDISRSKVKEPTPFKTSPELYCGYPSVLTFSWFSGLVALGRTKTLELIDLYKLNPTDTTYQTGRKFLSNFKLPSFNSYNFPGTEDFPATMENFEKCPSLVKAMVSTYGKLFFSASIFKLGNDILQFLNPIFLNLMIDFISSNQKIWVGYIYAILMFVGAVTVTVCLHQYFHRVFRIGMNMRSSLITLIYQKALKLDAASQGQTSVGELVTYMSTDTQRLADTMPYFAQIWSSPLQIIICMILLYNQLGWSAFAGLATCIILIPANIWAQKLVRGATIANMTLKSKRVKKTTEMLNGMKVMKLYSWEESFQNAINTIRDAELRKLWFLAKCGTVFSVLWGCAPVFISFAAFTTYIYTGTEANPHVLTSSKTFVSVSLFNILRFPLNVLPGIIIAIIQANVSVKRIEKYLKSGELDPKCVTKIRDKASDEKNRAVVLEDCDFTWANPEIPKINGVTNPSLEGNDKKETKDDFSLKNLNLEIKQGELTAIIGLVGSGKTSLVQSLLGDLYRTKGQATVHGKISYTAQVSWIMNMTLKDNILFSNKFDEEKYNKVIKSCALVDDITNQLPAGDQTEIGEKGINLSGGQKQRVALARSVYQGGDTFIFDDPLSAVDAHVGNFIFNNVMSNETGLLKDKTRILVTNAMQYVSSCDKVIILDQGEIVHQGSYEELKNDENALKMMTKFGVSDKIEGESSESNDETELIRKQKSKIDNEKLEKSKKEQAQKEKQGQLVEKEKAEEGNISWSVFQEYFKSVSYSRLFAIVVTNIFYVSASAGGRIWLAVWSNVSDEAEAKNPPEPLTPSENTKYVSIYGGLGLAQAAFVMFRTLALYWGCIRASRILHFNLLQNVIKLPMKFFDTTPLGRIINRFAKDIATVDDVLPRSFGFWLPGLFDVLSTIIICTYATPWFIAVIIPLLGIYFWLQRYFISTSRQLKRLESVSRSPIYNNFSETIGGVSTIRAFDKVSNFCRMNEGLVDTNMECYYPNISSNRWLAIRLEFIANFIVLAESVFATYARDTLNPAVVGLAISYAMSITQTLNWWVRQTSEIEANIVVVERIKEYTDLENEAPTKSNSPEGNRMNPPLQYPGDQWPSKGAIEFKNYSTRYRDDLPEVVKNISFKINPGEKVGIVGRTGAGKSSLTLALFRIIEASKGQILIDDVDISSMGLYELRKKLTIIPQDPFLFSGTLRYNLDPTCHSQNGPHEDNKQVKKLVKEMEDDNKLELKPLDDEKIWKALEQSGNLKEFISEKTDKLDFLVTENGGNFSAGQSQLLCLARALLRDSRILILDEATAAVDPKTDGQIQDTIRSEFKNWTILTIAHRINTIMDYDRILVLDKGEISEYDSPEKLLENKDGIFYSLVEQAGLLDKK